MAKQRRKLSTSNQGVPCPVVGIIDLVATLRATRKENEKIKSESNEFPTLQFLTETAALLSRPREEISSAADRAWQLINDCARVHRFKKQEHLNERNKQLLQQIPQPVRYGDAVRLITEEQRIDRASDKFQRFLKYREYGGELITNSAEYAAWQAAPCEYHAARRGRSDLPYHQELGESIKDLKLRGIEIASIEYMRKMYWNAQYQQFVHVADSVERSRSAKMGSSGKKSRR